MGLTAAWSPWSRAKFELAAVAKMRDELRHGDGIWALPVDQRVVPSVAAALLPVERGGRIVRVHDVKETVAALKVWAPARKGHQGKESSTP